MYRCSIVRRSRRLIGPSRKSRRLLNRFPISLDGESLFTARKVFGSKIESLGRKGRTRGIEDAVGGEGEEAETSRRDKCRAHFILLFYIILKILKMLETIGGIYIARTYRTLPLDKCSRSHV